MKHLASLLICLLLSLCAVLLFSCQKNGENNTTNENSTILTAVSTNEKVFSSAPPIDTTIRSGDESVVMTLSITEVKTTIVETNAPIEPETTSQSDTTAIQINETEPITMSETKWVDLHVDDYTITKKDKFYLNFDNGNNATMQEIAACQDPTVYFASLFDMKDAVMNGKLTDRQKACMRVGFPQNENGINICDMNCLSYPIAPQGYLLSDTVIWRGTNYCFFVGNKSTNGNGHITAIPKTTYDYYVDTYNHYFDDKTVLSVTDAEYDGVPCKLYKITTTNTVQKIYHLEAVIEEKQFHIRIDYITEHKKSPETVSETTPFRIEIIGCQNGRYFKVNLYSFTSAPSAEFLTSFGVEPYSGNNENTVVKSENVEE